MRVLSYPFSEADSDKAHEQWGANCGPNALAFATGLHIDQIRGIIPGFEDRHYTNPTMMSTAIIKLGRKYLPVRPHQPDTTLSYIDMFADAMALVRVQWTGPWTAPAANPKWAYRQTHWIAAWKDGGRNMVFDCNGGVTDGESWQVVIVPAILANYHRADGGWFPTHIWRLTAKSPSIS
jgi:hypothetical protein